MKRSAIARVLRWGPALVATIALAVFLAFVAWIYVTVSRAVDFQEAVRSGQAASAVVLTLQLDEETGLRGYTSTGQATFLQPYLQASSRFNTALTEERRALHTADPSGKLDIYADEQARIQERWQKTVAAPLIKKPMRADAVALQLQGKIMIDRFRAVNARIGYTLLQESQLNDNEFRAALRRIIAFGIFGAVILLAFSLGFARYSARINREFADQQARLENEKHIADTLQRAFLQRPLPTIADVELRATYTPSQEGANVGGDWYDAFDIDGRHLYFSIGDVCGHGVEAAVIMGRARQALLASALWGGNPSTTMAHANTSLILQDCPLVTALCGFIDLHTREVTYTTAGHPPPVLADSSGVRFLQHGGLPLGASTSSKYTTFRTFLAGGSLFALYTDGLLEYNRDVSNAERRVLDAVALIAAESSDSIDAARKLREIVLDGQRASDDIAILTMRFPPVLRLPNANASAVESAR